MRKFIVLLTIMALFVSALPTFADHHGSLPTIADIVIESASADEAEFSILLAAVSAADPSVLEALAADDASDEAQLTVFAPTDAAFATALEALGMTAEDLLADTELLTSVLLYHVISGRVMAENVVGLLEENEGSFDVETLNGKFATISEDMGNIYIDDAQIVTTDIEAKNGVIHVIDAVIMPLPTIAEVVVASAGADEPEFSTLLAAVSAADPAVLETLSDPSQKLTVFAPTDAAFVAALEALGISAEDLLADTETLTGILLYHVYGGEVYAEDVVGLLEANDGSVDIEMLDGNSATVATTDDGITIAGAKIIITDIAAANGVIHVIDAVILPSAE
jgi:uncharacterized surface protein with fasciclin (FAS1) repeats